MIEKISTVKKLNATVSAPSSKAHTLRALFIAALANGKSELVNPLIAEDQLIAINVLKKFGAKFSRKKDLLIVKGVNGQFSAPAKKVFVGNSGVTARFLTSFCALALHGETTITGNKRMQQRPMQALLKALKPLGVKAKSTKKNGFLPVKVKGKSFLGGKTSLKANASSQFTSSILISAPYAQKDTEIKIAGKLRSKPYIGITIDLMNSFGVKAKNNGYKKFFVKANQKYGGKRYLIEGDYSSAAYFFAAAAIMSGIVKVTNLKADSLQGDKFFLDCLKKMGCKIIKGKNKVTVNGSELKSIKVDMNDFPDIVMPLAVVCAFAKGKSTISNIGHLRFKESDRLKAIASELKKIGVKTASTNSTLMVEGCNEFNGARIDPHNDHRIAMSLAIAGLKVPGIEIKNPKCVSKSFPGFFKELKKLGEQQ